MRSFKIIMTFYSFIFLNCLETEKQENTPGHSRKVRVDGLDMRKKSLNEEIP